jgi:hypothetical protein
MTRKKEARTTNKGLPKGGLKCKARLFFINLAWEHNSTATIFRPNAKAQKRYLQPKLTARNKNEVSNY